MSLRPWRAGAAPVSGGRLAYHRTGGDLPSLVLSHGLTDSGLCWSRLAAALEERFDIVMLDARGHGESSKISGEHDPAQDIAEAVQALGLVSPILMGHSVGARATADCAAAHPGLARKVVLEDPPFVPLVSAEAMAKRRERFREHVRELGALSDAELVARGRAASPEWSEEEFPAWATAKRQVDPEAMPAYRVTWQESVACLAAPTLLVHGDMERGGIVTPDVAAEAEALNPRIQAVRIPRAGHNVRRENFADFVSAVRAFLLAP